MGAAQLRLEADTDGLTGLVNHRVFQERLLVEVDRAQRHGRALSLALVDIDGFKGLNDTFGHLVGDDVLARIAGHLGDAVRLTTRSPASAATSSPSSCRRPTRTRPRSWRSGPTT